MLSILPITLGLSVEAGLLNSTIPGCTVSVWVTVICRRRLLESREGTPSVRELMFMWVSRLTVSRLVLPPLTRCIPTRVSAMPLRTAPPVNRPNDRNITLILVSRPVSLPFLRGRGPLLTWTLLELTALR